MSHCWSTTDAFRERVGSEERGGVELRVRGVIALDLRHDQRVERAEACEEREGLFGGGDRRYRGDADHLNVGGVRRRELAGEQCRLSALGEPEDESLAPGRGGLQRA